jgi:hypothetical protein
VNSIFSRFFFQGYRDQLHSEEMASMVPAGLQGNADILFGNLHELYTFHSETFLTDLENCISTTELVALCFVQRVRIVEALFPANRLNLIIPCSATSFSACTHITVKTFLGQRDYVRPSLTRTCSCRNVKRNSVTSFLWRRIYLNQYKESRSTSCCLRICSGSATLERAQKSCKRRSIACWSC